MLVQLLQMTRKHLGFLRRNHQGDKKQQGARVKAFEAVVLFDCRLFLDTCRILRTALHGVLTRNLPSGSVPAVISGQL